MALGSTPLTEMSTKNLPGGKGRPATGIASPTVSIQVNIIYYIIS
jgi:hypothetical protein